MEKILPFSTPIETSRLLLRPLSVIDADSYYEIETNAEIKEFVGGITRNSRQDIRAKIINLSGKDFEPLAVVEKNSNQFIGRCGFIMNRFVNEVEIYIVLKKEMWEKGLGTETAKALLTLGFNSLGFKRIIGVVHPDNNRSKDVLKKLGMTYLKDISSNDYTNGFQVYCIEKTNLDIIT